MNIRADYRCVMTCSSVDHAHHVYGEQKDKDTRARRTVKEEDIKLIYTVKNLINEFDLFVLLIPNYIFFVVTENVK